jgi:hypothetical protein
MGKIPRRTGKTQDAPSRSTYYKDKADKAVASSLGLAKGKSVFDLPLTAVGVIKYALNEKSIKADQAKAKKLAAKESAAKTRIDTSKEWSSVKKK